NERVKATRESSATSLRPLLVHSRVDASAATPPCPRVPAPGGGRPASGRSPQGPRGSRLGSAGWPAHSPASSGLCPFAPRAGSRPPESASRPQLAARAAVLGGRLLKVVNAETLLG